MGSDIIDDKFEPRPAVSNVLSRFDAAWYAAQVATPNEAARAVHAQRQLTSYTDPFTGWIEIDGAPYVVRQRSPWKARFDRTRTRTRTLNLNPNPSPSPNPNPNPKQGGLRARLAAHVRRPRRVRRADRGHHRHLARARQRRQSARALQG